jgi:hypothetical protein
VPADGQNAREFWKKPPALPSYALALPDLCSVMLMEFRWTFHDMIIFKKQWRWGASNSARDRCVRLAAAIRRTFDNHPEIGEEASDALIAWEVRNARNWLDEDFAKGTWRH